jgi:hypothetical protein
MPQAILLVVAQLVVRMGNLSEGRMCFFDRKKARAVEGLRISMFEKP